MQDAILELQNNQQNTSSDKVVCEPESNDVRSIFHIHEDDAYF